MLKGAQGDEYLVTDLIARGGMGAVYMAIRVGDKTTWAIKEMSESVVEEGNHGQTIDAFHSEARLLETLDHENLPKVIDVFEYDHRQYLVMDLVDGHTLTQLMEQNSRQLKVADILSWAKQLCIVLNYLHDRTRPIIYRDLKPDNVMVEKGTGRVKLIDFGIARRFQGGKKSDTILLGTNGYAAPEQYGKLVQSDARTDLYALGATLHHLLTGLDPSQNPFKFDSIKNYNSGVSSRFCAAVEKAVQTERDKRQKNAADMYKALTGKALPAPKKRKAKGDSRKKPKSPTPASTKTHAGSHSQAYPAVLIQEIQFGTVTRGQPAVAPLAVMVSSGELKVRARSAWLQVQPQKVDSQTTEIEVTADTKKLDLGHEMRNVTYKPGWVVDGVWWLLLWLLYAHARPFVPVAKTHKGKVLVGKDEVDMVIEVTPSKLQIFTGWTVCGLFVAAELAVVVVGLLLLLGV